MKDIIRKFRLPLYLALMALVTCCSINIIYHYINKNNSSLSQVEEFNTVLNNRYEKSQRLLKDIMNSIEVSGFTDYNAISQKLPPYTSLFITKDDSLIFWSDNSIPLDFIIPFKRILKTPNGYFQQYSVSQGHYKYSLLDLIKYQYPYQNDYLVSSFNPAYSMSSAYEIKAEPTPCKVLDNNDNVLFYLNSTTKQTLSGVQEFFLYALTLTAFLLFIFALYYLIVIIGFSSTVSILIVFASVLSIRSGMFLLGIPHYLNDFNLFSPLNYASSPWLPSLGDLLTNTLIFVSLSYLAFRLFKNATMSPSNTMLKLVYTLLCLVGLTFIYYLSLYLIDTLIISSSFELDLSRILEFSFFSLIAYFIIALILLSFFFISYILVRIISEYTGKALFLPIFIVFSFGIWLLLSKYGIYTPQIEEIFLLLIYIILVFAIITKKLPFPHLTTTTLLILLLTIISSFCLYHNRETKEIEERKLMALRLSTDQDKVAEYLYAEIEKNIMIDTTLQKKFKSAWYKPAEETSCIEYIQNRYFNGFWTKYNAQITLCYPEKQLSLAPSNVVIGCNEYFDAIIANITEKTANKTLYYLKESYGNSSYLARIPITSSDYHNQQASIVIELTQKYVPKGLGYPELLLDKSFVSFYDMSTYSYAIYSNHELIRNVGDYPYSISEEQYLQYKGDNSFFNKRGYNHLYHSINDNTSIIISKKNLSLLDTLAPFTYQLIFHIIIIFLLNLVFNYRKLRKNYPALKTQLQIMLVALVLFSSVIIVLTTLQNIKSLNSKKNKDMLSEKAHSVLIEMEHNLNIFDVHNNVQQSNLQELLTKFSLVFFSDINIYSVHGDLMASSRPEIFEEGLKSKLINAEAFNQLSANQRTFYITNEQIGRYKYLSAYIPLRNKENKLVAYINLPYFAREHELRQEISSFLLAFVNIYIILTAIAVMISLIVSNYVTRPLQLIRDQFSNVKLDKKNEKIAYNRNDELGNLINEYNQMLDKLSDSADKLAQSERENAWKEMARQVAHEIKNPLTPMKLSIQHLYRSRKDNLPDWDARFTKTTNSLIQQIDSLAAIATAFSDFAKFPVPTNENIEIIILIKNTIALFNPQPEFNISFNHPKQHCYVYADRKQLTRVMINLLNNAIQSIPIDKIGQIDITLKSEGSEHIILISDNGIGIPEEQKSKIFSPNFTTKSAGTGLGLAMVKNIIYSANGSITFSSDTTGTTFEIRLPAVKPENKQLP